MLNIVTKAEPLRVETICILVYGSPGIGKTSAGFTAQTPILLDFDGGAHRSQFRQDCVPVQRWADVAEMTAGDLAAYDTVVVDTVGRLLDHLSAHIIDKNPKMRGYGGALSLQGYGALKAEYAGWLQLLRSYGKDVVLLAHDKEDKSGDELLVRPDIQGGSYGEVFKRADGVGYMHKVSRDTVLDFSPTERWVGKNAAGFDPLVVPNFTSKPEYLAGVISDIKGAINALSDEQMEAIAKVDEWREIVSAAKDADALNGLISECSAIDDGPVKQQVRALVQGQAKALGLVLDRSTKLYAEAA